MLEKNLSYIPTCRSMSYRISVKFTKKNNLLCSADSQEFSGSIFHNVKPDLSAGVQLSYSGRTNNTKIGIAGLYRVDENVTIRAKVNTSSQIGLAYQQKLHERITLGLSTLIDAKNFNSGGHKLGFALEMEA